MEEFINDANENEENYDHIGFFYCRRADFIFVVFVKSYNYVYLTKCDALKNFPDVIESQNS